MTDDELLRQFEDCMLPFGQWVHRAHVKVAYLYLTRHPFERAVERMRLGFGHITPPTKCPTSRPAAIMRR